MHRPAMASGVGLTRADYLGLDIAHRDWIIEKLRSLRDAEAKAMKAAGRKR